MMETDNCITIIGSKAIRLLAVIAAVLILASVASQVFKVLTGRDHVYGLVPLFNLNEEGNVPTFFSSSILLV